MTLNKQILDVIDGSHVMENSPLGAYHTAQAVKDAMRKREAVVRFSGIKSALKNYRVMVSYCSNGQTRVFRPDTRQELYLGKDLWNGRTHAEVK